jgi:tripartite-type tricarboxylate transporter receptor subunit TctC
LEEAVRSIVSGVLLLASALGITAPASAQQYPARPVYVSVGYAPGSSSDLFARTIGDELQARWKQPIVVENRPGSGSNVAASFVARSLPDGYNLLVATDATLTSNVFLYNSITFDPVKDFAPVIKAADNIIVLAVNPDLPVKSVPELIDYAKKRPGELTYGSSGVGSPHHLAGELLEQMAGLKLTHVPYKGGGPAVADLIGGHISMAFLSLSAARPFHDAGKIRIIASVEKKRYAGTPDIPVIGESLPGFEMSSWIALVAPKDTPSEIVSRVNTDINSILKEDQIRTKLGDLGLAVSGGPPSELEETIMSGLDVRGRLIKAAGIAPE